MLCKEYGFTYFHKIYNMILTSRDSFNLESAGLRRSAWRITSF